MAIQNQWYKWKKIIGSFHEKESLLSKLWICFFFPKLDNDIKDKVKVILDLTNYATKKEL